MSRPRHLLEIDDLSRDELVAVLELAATPHPPRSSGDGDGPDFIFLRRTR